MGVFVLKIVVAGSFQSGKSSYIQALDNKALNIMTIDKSGKKTTIAMDIASYEYQGIKISLFGTPGLLRFKTIRSIVMEGADGVIFMFDGVNSDNDDSALQILNEIRSKLPRNTPIVYVVNKSDVAGCREIDVVRAQNYIPKEATLISISALNKVNVQIPIQTIISMIKISLSPIIKTLEKYEENPLGLKVALEKSAEKILEFLNAMEMRGILSINRHTMTFKLAEKAKLFMV